MMYNQGSIEFNGFQHENKLDGLNVNTPQCNVVPKNDDKVLFSRRENDIKKKQDYRCKREICKRRNELYYKTARGSRGSSIDSLKTVHSESIYDPLKRVSPSFRKELNSLKKLVDDQKKEVLTNNDSAMQPQNDVSFAGNEICKRLLETQNEFIRQNFPVNTNPSSSSSSEICKRLFEAQRDFVRRADARNYISSIKVKKEIEVPKNPPISGKETFWRLQKNANELKHQMLVALQDRTEYTQEEEFEWANMIQQIRDYLLECDVREDLVACLPDDLLLLFETSMCALCTSELTSESTATAHYTSMVHMKKLKIWMNSYCTLHGIDLPKGIIGPNFGPLKPRNECCELCNVVFDDEDDMREHYSDRLHKLVVDGKRMVKDMILLKAPEGIHRKQQLIQREKVHMANVRNEEPTDDYAMNLPTDNLTCEVCQLRVTSMKTMESHVNGAKHKNKLRKIAQGDQLGKVIKSHFKITKDL